MYLMPGFYVFGHGDLRRGTVFRAGLEPIPGSADASGCEHRQPNPNFDLSNGRDRIVHDYDQSHFKIWLRVTLSTRRPRREPDRAIR
jgi:hypothetical protein